MKKENYSAAVDWHAQQLVEAMEKDPELRDAILREYNANELIEQYESLPEEEKDLSERFEQIELEEARRRQLDALRLKKNTQKKPRLSKKEKYSNGNPLHNYQLEFHTNPETVKKLKDQFEKKKAKIEELKGKDKVHPIEMGIY